MASAPDWLPVTAWDAYIAMRKQMGKKHVATEHAQTLLIKKLDAMRKEGQDIEAVINESIMRSWTGLFPIKIIVKNWWESDEGALQKGREMSMAPRVGEGMREFKARINVVIEHGGIERRTEPREYQADAPIVKNHDLAKQHIRTALNQSKIRH